MAGRPEASLQVDAGCEVRSGRRRISSSTIHHRISPLVYLRAPSAPLPLFCSPRTLSRGLLHPSAWLEHPSRAVPPGLPFVLAPVLCSGSPTPVV